MTPLDRTIALDPANPLPMRVFDNGDGTYSLATHDPSGVKTRTTHITSAQLLDLHNTLVELVPSPGPGKSLVPLSWALRLHFGSAAYQGALPGVTLRLLFSPDSNSLGVLDSDSQVIVAANDSLYWEPIPGSIASVDAAVDEALVVSPTHQLIDGDGTLDVTIVYVVVG